MPIAGPIPQPKSFIDSFMDQIKDQQENRLKQAQADYQTQESQRLNKMTPYEIELKKAQAQEAWSNANPDLLKAKIESEQALAQQRRNNPSGGSNSMGAGGKEQQNFMSLIAKDNPQLNNDPVKVYEAANALAEGKDSLSDGTKLNNMSPLARASFDRITKYGNTAQGLNQQRYANTTDALVDASDQNAQGAITYSGLLGGAQGTSEKATQLLGGESNPNYQKYIDFTRTDVPTIAGEFMRELGVNASDEQKRMYKEVINPIAWDTNPKLALARWNHFKEIMNTVKKSVGGSTSENKQKLSKNNSSSSSKYQEASNESEVQGKEPPAGTIWMLTPKNKKVPVHKDNVEYAKSQYGYKDVG